MKLRVDFFYDDEVDNWGFVVPALHIIGGAHTRDEARQQAQDAITFALEGTDEDAPPEPDVEVEYFTIVAEQPAAAKR